MKLFEVDHPYYMTDGCYFSAGCHQEYGSWSDFLEEWKDADMDYNWVIRWDWMCLENGSFSDLEEQTEAGGECFKVQFFIQRKAYPISARIKVTKKDEPEIHEWLQKYADYMKLMWKPLL